MARSMIPIVWEENGPNLITTVAGQEIFIGQNDRTGRYTIAVNGKPLSTTWPSRAAAKASVTRIALAIVREVR